MLSALWEMPKELLVITKSWTWEHASAAAADYWKAKETAKKNTGGGTLWWSLWLMLRCPKKMKTAQVVFPADTTKTFFLTLAGGSLPQEQWNLHPGSLQRSASRLTDPQMLTRPGFYFLPGSWCSGKTTLEELYSCYDDTSTIDDFVLLKIYNVFLKTTDFVKFHFLMIKIK